MALPFPTPIRRRATMVVALAFLATAACDQGSSSSELEMAYEGLTADYIEAWKAFYPNSAVRLGLDQHLLDTEDRSTEGVEDWIRFNTMVRDSLVSAPEDLSVNLRIDLRLLKNRVQAELSAWLDEVRHRSSPAMYASVVRGLADVPESPKRIQPEDLSRAVQNRLAAIVATNEALASQLETGDRRETQGAVRTLMRARSQVVELAGRFPEAAHQAESATGSIDSAILFLEGELEMVDGSGDFRLGRDRFAEELRLYYDMEITPEDVAERALSEISVVRDLIAAVSREHWEESHTGELLPEDVGELLSRVSADMEENRPTTQQESLVAFTRFAEEAEAFVRDQGIATLPPDRTLEIVLTPESAGSSTRIGFVNSAPPFDPDPVTILSLPTIPDSYPEAEKEDFYRSFNNHFNKMIIIHELFPGHYMQLKIASGSPRLVRTFFPYEPYIEGWATLVETLALDAGWDDFNKLTYLSHLRKRLENANRAYTSVQVHCYGWEEAEVSRFSREEALLAPQFAASLWGRLTRGPMQMTSYFMGKDMFMEVLEGERARLGEEFEIRAFTDTILQAGAIPVDMVPELLEGGG